MLETLAEECVYDERRTGQKTNMGFKTKDAVHTRYSLCCWRIHFLDSDFLLGLKMAITSSLLTSEGRTSKEIMCFTLYF